MAEVFKCECGFRGKEAELVDGKCPRDGGTVKSELSGKPATRATAKETATTARKSGDEKDAS